jgi:hypothetical protein
MLIEAAKRVVAEEVTEEEQTNAGDAQQEEVAEQEQMDEGDAQQEEVAEQVDEGDAQQEEVAEQMDEGDSDKETTNAEHDSAFVSEEEQQQAVSGAVTGTASFVQANTTSRRVVKRYTGSTSDHASAFVRMLNGVKNAPKQKGRAKIGAFYLCTVGGIPDYDTCDIAKVLRHPLVVELLPKILEPPIHVFKAGYAVDCVNRFRKITSENKYEHTCFWTWEPPKGFASAMQDVERRFHEALREHATERVRNNSNEHYGFRKDVYTLEQAKAILMEKALEVIAEVEARIAEQVRNQESL